MLLINNQIKTPNLQLDIVSNENAFDIFNIFSNHQVVRYTAIQKNKTIDDTYKIIAKWEKGLHEKTNIFWSIKKHNSSQTIGIIGLSYIDHEHSFASITCALDQPFFGKGIGSEALKALVVFAINNLSLNRLEAQVFEDNLIAVNLFSHLKFYQEGILRKNFLIEGNFENSIMFSLLKSDFEKAGDFFKF